MRRQIEHLELRQLLSLPNDVFCEASDRYQIAIGTTIPFTPITTLQWGATNGGGGAPTADPFAVILPSGPYSPQLLQWAASGTNLVSVRVEQLTSSSRVRTRWDMTVPFINSFTQVLGGDGTLYDQVAFSFRRMTETFFVPNPGGGADIPTTADWDFFTATGTNLALANTLFMSTSPEVRSTFEVARGQMALDGFSFSVTSGGGQAVAHGPDFTNTAGVDGVPLLTKLLAPGTAGRLTDAVYIQRDDQARPIIRDRFSDITPVRYSFSDTVGDGLPRAESWSFVPLKAQIISYTYAANGTMNPPVSNGWNFTNSTSFNPVPVTAFIQPPTFGPRNTPLASVDIQFSHAVGTLALSNFSFENITTSGLTLTSSNGGLNWTIGNLASQQVNGGSYGIKLFAVGSGILSGTNALIGSTGTHWTLDTSAPSVTSVSFVAAGAQNLRYGFSEDVSASLTTPDLTLFNLTTGTTINPGAMTIAYDGTTNTATFSFPGLANGVLPDGSYRATLSGTGVTDPAGNGLAGGDKIYNFIWSAGTSGDDAFRVDLDPAGTTVRVFRNTSAPSFTAARSSLGTIALAGLAGDDSLSVDLINGNPIPIDHIKFDGGANTSAGDIVAFSGTAPVADAVSFDASSIHWIGSGDEGFIDFTAAESLQFNGKGGGDAVTLSGPLPLTLVATQHLASLTMAANTRAALLAGGSRVLVAQALSLASTAQLDVNDNDLVLDYSGASQLAAIQQLINTARANGSWTGNGLTSSAARQNPQHNTTLGAIESADFKAIYGSAALFSGEPIDATAVLVKYTYYGDSDFNGRVNFDDYVRTDNGFNQHKTGWLNGDFDGNGVVNFDDYVLIDLAFNTQSTPLGRARG
jgi:hypothetical protein